MRSVWWAVTGAVIVVTAITWAGPTLISWWFTPPVDTLFNCKGPIEWSLKRFQWAQLVGLLLGGILGFTSSLAIKRPQKSNPL